MLKFLRVLLFISFFTSLAYADSPVRLEVKTFDGNTIFVFYHERNQKINIALRGKIVQATAEESITDLQVLNHTLFSNFASQPKLAKDKKSITFSVKETFQSQSIINGEKLTAIKLQQPEPLEEPHKQEEKAKAEEPETHNQPGQIAIKYSPLKGGSGAMTFDLGDIDSTMAAFFRGKYLWVVFDSYKSFTFQDNGVVEDFSQTANDKASILRFRVKGYNNAKVSKNGTKWTIELTNHRVKDQKYLLTPKTIEDEAIEIKGDFGASQIVEFHDPEIGDLVRVLPLSTPSARVQTIKESVDFNILPSIQGIAVAMGSEDVDFIKDKAALKIISNHNLPAVEDKAPLPQVNTDLGSVGSLLPLLDKKLDIIHFLDTRTRLMLEISTAANPTERFNKYYELFRFYFVNAMYNEALESLITAKRVSLSDYNASLKARFGVAVTLTLTDYLEEAKPIYEELLKGMPPSSTNEIALWNNYNEFVLAKNPVNNIGLLANLNKSVNLYPDELYWPLVFTELELSLLANDMKQVESIFKEIRTTDGSKEGITGSLKFYKANYYRKKGQVNLALQFLQDLASQDTDLFNKTRAEFELVKLQLAQKQIQMDEAIKRLEAVRFDWRGDTLEYNILMQLAAFYRAAKDSMGALRTYHYVQTAFSNQVNNFYITSEMVKIFNDVFLPGGSLEEMEDFKAVALFYEFRDLNPIGEQGDDVILEIARRLTRLDLLAGAAELLRHQVRYRLTGAKRILNADHLAIILLMDKKPSEAIKVLDETDRDNARFKEHEYRVRLKAQGLVDLGKYNDALQYLKDDISDDASVLRREIYYRAEKWNDYITVVAPGVQAMLPNTLSNGQVQDIVRLATAYYMTNNHGALEDLSNALGNDAKRQVLRNTVDLFRLSGAPVDYKNLDESLNVDQMQMLLDKYKMQLFSQGS